MNMVAFAARATCGRPPGRPASMGHGAASAPVDDWRAGRGRSVGSVSTRGRRGAAPPVVHQSAEFIARAAGRAAIRRSRRSPATAPAAPRQGCPSRYAPTARRPGSATDRPSLTMWCITSANKMPAGSGMDQHGPDQRPGGQVERDAGESGRDRLGLPCRAALSPAGPAARRVRSVDPGGVGDDLLGNAVECDDAGAQAAWRAATASIARCSAPASSGAVQPHRVGHEVRRFAGRELVEEPQPLLRERHREAASAT